MTSYAVRRFLLLLVTLWGISLIVFTTLRVLPPDNAVDRILGEYGGDDPALKRQLEDELGLSASLPAQYFRWAGEMLTGDLGESLHTSRPIVDELRWRIPISFEVSILGLFFTWVLSFPLGVLAAVKQDRGLDYLLRGGAYLIESIPVWALAIVALLFLALNFNWAPPTTFTYLWDDPVNHLKIMVLPTVIIGIGASGNLVRFTRTFLLEVLREDYIRTARAKGLPERMVLWRHALRNTAIPFVTIIGASIPGLLTSGILFEQLFLLPGMGRYTIEATRRLDYPVMQSTTMIFATIALTAILITDLCYALVDPRISYARQR